MRKQAMKVVGRNTLLPILFFLSTFLYAITPVKVPGELKDINATSKVWLSSNSFPIIFYTKDTNLSRSLSASIKSVENEKEIAFFVAFKDKLDIKKDINSSIDIKTSLSNEPISFTQNLSFNIGIKNGFNIIKKIQNNFIKDDQTILDKKTTTTIKYQKKYAYYIKNHQKNPIYLDDNQTLSIGFDKDKLYIVKSKDRNKTSTSISFSINIEENNQTILYQTKWIKLHNTPTSDKLIAGETQNGKKIFLQNCLACHRYNNDTTAPKGIAPMLTNVGGWANIEYLKDILLHPNKYQTNRYAKLEKEGKIMPMPSYEWLSSKEMDDLISFLKTLKCY